MANHPRVVGDVDLEWSEHSHGENFGSRRKQLGSPAGGETWEPETYGFSTGLMSIAFP